MGALAFQFDSEFAANDNFVCGTRTKCVTSATEVRQDIGRSPGDFDPCRKSDLDWMRHVFQGGGSATAANDNWVGIDYGYDASHRLTSTSATDSRIMGAIPTAGAYGAANALNQVANVPNRAPMTWSDAGNMQTDGKGTTFVHDGNNRLIKATKANSDVYHFRYDGDGLRMETTKNPDPTLSANFQHTGGTKTRYVTSATEEIADLDGNRIVLRRYIAGPAIDERVAQVDATGNVTYIHTDKQNSVVALSNSSGAAVSRRGYGTYGETNPTQMAETTHPFGYTGRRWEADLGLYYYRARWYDPELGTFLETDPIGSLDYINLYSYVGLNPMNAMDPSGMQTVPGMPLSVYGDQTANAIRGSGGNAGAWLSKPFFGDIKGDAARMGIHMANDAIHQYQSGAISPSQFDLRMAYAYDAMENAAVLPATNGQAVGQLANAASIAGTPFVSGLGLARVGRWMSPGELNAMVKTGMVQQSTSGATHVSFPGNPSTYRAAPSGSVYVEFNVPKSSLTMTSNGVASVNSPLTAAGRAAARRGESVALPQAQNLVVLGTKK